ncbi:MAG: putative acyltransferase [Sphingomonadales bacterium]|nr:putative acyltransferase [Sphingomonadales bacterium]
MGGDRTGDDGKNQGVFVLVRNAPVEGRDSAQGMTDSIRVGQSLHVTKYRADIDGLRAIAVSSVVISHALPAWLPGGFVGVDVFFVISGYLISLILIEDIREERFSVLKFYDRRIRRIFPALITTFLFTWAVGWALLFRPEFLTLGRHIVASTLFAENYLLWSESGYFDVSSQQKMLLHLWSLAIEEQFYIFWPLLIFLSTRRFVIFLPMLVILGLLSFGFNIYEINHDLAAAYYSAFGRFWELLIGAGLAWLTVKRADILSQFGSLYSAFGALLLLAALIFINPTRDFPGFWALLPTAGTFLLIAGGENAWVNRIILASPPFVWCGLISYPLYLWHWPLISFTYMVAGAISTPKAIVLVALSVAAATLTFWYIERPLRRREASARQTLSLIATMVGVGLLGCLTMESAISPRLSHFKAPAKTEWDFLLGRTSHPDKNANGIYPIYADRSAITLVMGDSHVAQYAERMTRVMETSNLRGAIFAVGGGCVPIDGADTDVLLRRGCSALREASFQMAMQHRIDTVVIGASWNRLFTDDQNSDYFRVHGQKIYFETDRGRKLAFDRLAERIRRFRMDGKRVFLVLDGPIAPDFSPRGLKARLSLSVNNFSPNRFVTVRPSQVSLHVQMRALARKNGAIVVDPFPTLCEAEKRCRATDDSGLPIYKDAGHFNPEWVVGHANFIDGVVKP